MTPRQLHGWLSLTRRDRRAKKAELLHVILVGSRGEPKDVKEQFEKLQKDL